MNKHFLLKYNTHFNNNVNDIMHFNLNAYFDNNSVEAEDKAAYITFVIGVI